jgi:CDGSH-type Zn-finger protein
VRVKVVQNGPLQVRGPVELIDHDGNRYDLGARTSVVLCRCGGSTTKPFCDGTHSRIGFAAAERAVAEADNSTSNNPAAGGHSGGNAPGN